MVGANAAGAEVVVVVDGAAIGLDGAVVLVVDAVVDVLGGALVVVVWCLQEGSEGSCAHRSATGAAAAVVARAVVSANAEANRAIRVATSPRGRGLGRASGVVFVVA